MGVKPQLHEVTVMAVTIRDENSVAVLAATTGVEVEIRGPDGLLLGYFTPAPRPGMSFPELGIPDAEIDRLIADPNTKWVSGEEVMARLNSLRDAP